MNTLDDLRAQLTDDAAAVGDDGALRRHDGVHARIRARRRTRRAAAATGAVAAVAAVALALPLVTTGRTPEPPAAAMPEDVVVDDFGYALRDVHRSEPGATSLEVPLGADGTDAQDLAFALETEDLPAGARVTVSTGYDQVLGEVVGGGVALPPYPLDGFEEDLRVEVDGAGSDTVVEVGIYERTDALPEGLSNGEAVFRDRVGGEELVGGAFLADGEAEGSFQFTGRLSDVQFARYCDGPRDVGVTVEVDGGLVSGGTCDGETDVDAYAGGLYGVDDGSGVATHTVRFWTSDEAAGSRVVAREGVDLGVAVYSAGPQRRVGGIDVDEVTAADGREWQLDTLPGRSTRVALGDRDVPVLVGFVATERGRSTFLSIDGERTAAGVEGGGWSLGEVVWPGRDVRLELVDLRGRPVDGEIVVYRAVG